MGLRVLLAALLRSVTATATITGAGKGLSSPQQPQQATLRSAAVNSSSYDPCCPAADGDCYNCEGSDGWCYNWDCGSYCSMDPCPRLHSADWLSEEVEVQSKATALDVQAARSRMTMPAEQPQQATVQSAAVNTSSYDPCCPAADGNCYNCEGSDGWCYNWDCGSYCSMDPCPRLQAGGNATAVAGAVAKRHLQQLAPPAPRLLL